MVKLHKILIHCEPVEADSCLNGLEDLESKFNQAHVQETMANFLMEHDDIDLVTVINDEIAIERNLVSMQR